MGDSYNSRQSAYFNFGTAGTGDFQFNSGQEQGLSFGRNQIGTYDLQGNSFQNQAQSFQNMQLDHYNDYNPQRYFRNSGAEDLFEMKIEDVPIQNLQIAPQNHGQQDTKQQLVQSIASDQSRNSRSQYSNSIEQDFRLDSDQINKQFKPEVKLQIPVNQGKSIYREKIDLLLEKRTSTTNSISPCITPRSSKSQQKYERKKSQNIQSEVSNDQADPNEPNESKLAKNRESAKNSRERKKIYQQLLEKQVFELQEDNERLKELCKSQEFSIDSISKSSQKFSLFIEQQQLLFQNLDQCLQKKEPEEKIKQVLDAMRYKLNSAKNQFIINQVPQHKIHNQSNNDDKVDEIWGTLKEILNPNQLGQMMCCIYNNQQQNTQQMEIQKDEQEEEQKNKKIKQFQ